MGDHRCRPYANADPLDNFDPEGMQARPVERWPTVAEMGKDLVSPSTYASGYISIGHAEDWDIVTKRGDGRIFVLEGAEPSPEETDDQYATIYHFIYQEAVGAQSKG